MIPLETGAIKIDTRTAGVVVHVCPREGGVLLMIGEPGVEGSRSATMSSEQAEMVLHALGLTVARIREEARLRAEERAGLAERLLDQEVRLRGS
ncbi:MAG: hypothetical protein HYR50_04080 [Candidatus Rokubacteria bacterium]|nr:hypothetical protein [Candidatus Rokubacteria bacterium]